MKNFVLRQRRIIAEIEVENTHRGGKSANPGG
jgi:hypothetical protein